MKYKTKLCTVRGKDTEFDVLVALDSWDGIEDAEDEAIFYYMNGEPLRVGSVLDDYIVTNIKG